jgi:glucokinase
MAGKAIFHVLIGDVGGTNIRFELIELNTKSNGPISMIKKSNLSVADH